MNKLFNSHFSALSHSYKCILRWILISKSYVFCLILTLPVVSQAAGVLATPICKAYKAIFDNDLFAVIGFIALVGCILMWMLDDGNSKTKTTALKIASLLLVLLNIENIFSAVFSRSIVC